MWKIVSVICVRVWSKCCSINLENDLLPKLMSPLRLCSGLSKSPHAECLEDVAGCWWSATSLLCNGTFKLCCVKRKNPGIEVSWCADWNCFCIGENKDKFYPSAADSWRNYKWGHKYAQGVILPCTTSESWRGKQWWLGINASIHKYTSTDKSLERNQKRLSGGALW